jgi:hypothetical protein
VSNRCKGLLIYVKGNCTINGILSMTARGASVDPTSAGVPSTGIRIIRKKTGQSSTLAASDMAGCGSAAIASEAFQPGIAANGQIFVIARTGANGGAAVTAPGEALIAGNPGAAGTAGQSGGGGSGDARWFSGPTGRGGNGTCFSGGPGGGACNNAVTAGVTAGSDTGGPGGNTSGTNAVGSGAGNPAGAAASGVVGTVGTGGLLILIVGGNLTIGASGVIASDGSIGGSSQAAGGSSGGGPVLVLYAGTLSNSGTVRSLGGASPGGGGLNAGGNGSVQGPTQIAGA